MLSKNAVRALAALVAIFFAAGLLEYAHLSSSARSHLGVTSSSPTSSPVGPPDTRPSRKSHDFRAPPAAVTTPRQVGSAHSRAKVPSGSRANDRVPPAATAGQNAIGSLYIVQPGDTLWHVAALRLGNPARWTELFAHNRGRHEPGGGVLIDPNRIYPGWTIGLPVSAENLRSAGTNISASHVLAGAVATTETAAPVTAAQPGGAW